MPDFKSPRGLTGVRFHEQIQDCECVYEIATYVPSYLEAVNCASLARSDYQKMSKNAAFCYLLDDLLGICILNANIFDPLYRVGVAPGPRFRNISSNFLLQKSSTPISEKILMSNL